MPDMSNCPSSQQSQLGSAHVKLSNTLDPPLKVLTISGNWLEQSACIQRSNLCRPLFWLLSNSHPRRILGVDFTFAWSQEEEE